MNRCPFLLPPCGFFEFYKTGIVKDIVIALKRDLYRKGGGEEDFRGRFLDSPRSFSFFLLNDIIIGGIGIGFQCRGRAIFYSRIFARTFEKRKEKRGGKEKKKEKECRSSTYDAAVNRLMAMQKGRQGSNVARHSGTVCCIILK